MNNLQNRATSQHKPNPFPILGMRSLERFTNAVVCTSKIKNSLAKNKAPWGNFYRTKSSTIHTHTASIVEQKQKYNGNKHTKGVYTQ